MQELIQVYKPSNSTGKPRIVFIHGLNGSAKTTWMADEKDEKTLWPRWLGEDAGCPVWTVGYKSGKSAWAGHAMPIKQNALAILERLSAEPAIKGSPLILIGHSMGGLVIKYLMTIGATRNTQRHQELVRCIKGVAFIGTPHLGSMIATLFTMIPFARANDQMNDLKGGNSVLVDLNTDFLALRSSQKFETRVYIEAEPYELFNLSWLNLGKIVSRASSEPHIPGEAGIPVAANHRTICKPSNKEAPIYKSVLNFVREFSATQSSGIPAPSETPYAKPSGDFDASPPGPTPIKVIHAGLAYQPAPPNSELPSAVAVTALVTTDEPERVKREISELRAAVENNVLVNGVGKALARDGSLSELLDHPSTRSVAQTAFATISISAYIYYWRDSGLSTEHLDDHRKFILPLKHRLSKKGERVEFLYTRVPNALQHAALAAHQASREFHRKITPPKHGTGRHSVLAEVAALFACATARHLADLKHEEATTLFMHLRTRIRYAENIVTGEKHTRDLNPLP